MKNPRQPAAAAVPSRPLSLLLLALALALLTGLAPAATLPVPAVPAYATLPLPDNEALTISANGELSWLGRRTVEPAPKGVPQGCWASELVLNRWQPATGATRRAPLASPLSGFVIAQLPLPAGLLALTSTGCEQGKVRTRILLLPAGGGAALKVETDDVPTWFPIQLLALGNDAVALVTRDKDLRHIQVTTVRRLGSLLRVDRMPALPIAYHGDFAAAIAGKDQVMILGGSDGKYRGCADCRAQTHLLDLKTRVWRAGPAMAEARSELGASTLPDGSVLVTGGWTKAAGWGNGPSRTAERWDPAANRFEPLPPMPTGNARHQHVWWTAPWGRTLLVVQGLAGAAHAFDPVARTWRTVAEWPQGSEEGGCGFYPFVLGGNAYAWQMNNSEGHYSSKSCLEQKYASLSLLRPPATAAPAPQPASDQLLISYRANPAILPASGTEPLLVIGGALHAGMNSYVKTSAVDAVSRDGRFASWPSLRIARQDAAAFRVAGGVLVVGGTGPHNAYGGDRDPKPLPAEWLHPAGTMPWQWQEVTGAGIPPGSAVAQMKDGSLLVLAPGGAFQQLQFVPRDNLLTLQAAALPGLSRERRNGPDEHDQVRLQQLDDGRLVVAGGAVRSERIALFSDKVVKPDARDEYVGIGEFLPSRRHEIFDPATRRWTTSAPSAAPGGRAIILADGRVVKAGEAPRGKEETGPVKAVLEISNAAGTAWTRLVPTGSPLRIDDKLRLFTLEGELFASGELEGVSTGGGPSGLQWWNSGTRQWETLWQAVNDDNWRVHVGRMVVRTLTGSDGKSKTLVLPVGGL